MTPEQLKYSILRKAFCGQLVLERVGVKKSNVQKIECDESPFDIPDEWFWSSLGYCCEIYTGNSISENVKKTKYAGLNEGYDYIATKDVSFEHTIDYDNGIKIPSSDGFKIAYEGSVLMCIEGGSAGKKIAILEKDVCFGNKLCSFNSKEVLNSYIYYYLQSYEFKSFFVGNMSGIIGGVSIKKLKELPIPIPPYDEQLQIVKKIEELLPFVERYAVSYKKLELFNSKFPEDMRKSILQFAIQGKLVEQRSSEENAEILYKRIQDDKQKLISEGKIKKEKVLEDITEDDKIFEIPDTWKWTKLGCLAYKITDGTHKTPQYTTEGIKFVSAKDITTGTLIFDECKYITEEEHKILYERCNPEKGDILISKSGSIGTAVINCEDFQFSLFESLALVKYNQEFIMPQYLKYAITNACFHLSEKEVKGVAVKHLPIAAITNMVIPLPPRAEQERIVSRIEEMIPYCDRLKK